MKQGRTDRDWAVVAVMTFAAGAVLTWALMSKPSPKSVGLAFDWPAWVQAIGSIAAIIAAGLIPLWHARVRRREVTQSLIELISYARFPATLMLAQFEGGFGGPRLILAHLTQLHKAFDSVNYVDVPNRSLAIALQQSATAVSALKGIQELFLRKEEMKKGRGIEIVKKYLLMLDRAVEEAIKATGQRPRDFNYDTIVLPNE
ncbi:hypothetical protein [Stenotrophomonas sp. S39]|uniref:hypothetical protein n=1 Tax=Stenotrophomonas sp. S39 TaxID=2767451 RepID=UPI00190C0D6C|nr:hypothetical protein [Stenotrophomonas sp. S39]MBK0052741.1 hypothetical protein [Stenotrophomonas sp. S39]